MINVLRKTSVQSTRGFHKWVKNEIQQSRKTESNDKVKNLFLFCAPNVLPVVGGSTFYNVIRNAISGNLGTYYLIPLQLY